ncbi:MAG: T9SS type A sorting domain-containing protein [Bacteroidetes bacterium]|nr:T9SS type A sorting domain-containing protein [Bacteroidota bacterium]
MKKQFLLATVMLAIAGVTTAQIPFPVNIDTAWTAKTIWMPKSPLKTQVIFTGGVDVVKTTATYGNPAAQAYAKQWHDFIGFSADKSASGDLGWVVVNHEMTQRNDYIGDGGGMTMFKLKRGNGDTLKVVEQTLSDGRKGKYFNVDFVNTVGETGMNCGGITDKNTGRIWTAEEWMQTSNRTMFNAGLNYRDTGNFTIGVTSPAGFPGFNGKTIKRYQNLNWMVEIDPVNAKAIRKQYNWGRAGWEGGLVLPDNKTVFLFEDGSPGILAKFVATNAGDFTNGQLYVYKHDAPTKWITIENNLDTLLELNTVAIRRGATMFNRLEWGAYHNGKIYITETGRDAFTFNSGIAKAGVVSPALIEGYKIRFKTLTGKDFAGTDAQASDSVRNGRFADYYGRVLEFDVNTNLVRSFLEGGPYFGTATSQGRTAGYPMVHLSNPDGLNFLTVKGKTYMMIHEDLNGVSYNRMPANTTILCELYLLDMSIANPTLSDLMRLTACPPGAEITGGIAIDSKTILTNAQHSNVDNPFPYNQSFTYAITGFDGTPAVNVNDFQGTSSFSIYPNPVAQELHLSRHMDVAIYDGLGSRVKVLRNVAVVSVVDLKPGVYFIRNAEGETLRFVVQ